MDEKTILKKIEWLNKEINFYYWKYYNNSVLQNLYDKDIYNSIIDFYWKPYKKLKKLKQYYIKNRLELNYWVENNSDIIEYQNKARLLINSYFTNI